LEIVKAGTLTSQESRLGELDLDNVVFGETFSDHMFSMLYENGA